MKKVRNKSGVLAPAFVKLFLYLLWGFFGVPERKIQSNYTSKAELALKQKKIYYVHKTQKKTSRAQLRMGESIIVLIIFFIILSLGAVFYARISVEKTAQDKAELRTIDAVKVAQQIAKLPEVICTKEGVTDFDCFDEYKYQAFAEIAGKQSKHFKYYESLFPNIKASVVKIYPQNIQGVVILDTTLKDKNKNDKVIATSGQKFFIPITIYNPLEEQSSFGYLELEVYS